MEYIKRNSLILGLFLLCTLGIAGWLVSRFARSEEILAAPIEIKGEKNITRKDSLTQTASDTSVQKETI